MLFPYLTRRRPGWSVKMTGWWIIKHIWWRFYFVWPVKWAPRRWYTLHQPNDRILVRGSSTGIADGLWTVKSSAETCLLLHQPGERG